MGAVGSVAILVQAIENELVIELKRTCFLEPTFSLLDPRRLVYVREQYIVDADGLKKAGFGEFPDGNYWFTRDFTEFETIWYEPIPVEYNIDKNINLIRDEARCTQHELGVVPIVWIDRARGIHPNSTRVAWTEGYSWENDVSRIQILEKLAINLMGAGDDCDSVIAKMKRKISEFEKELCKWVEVDVSFISRGRGGFFDRSRMAHHTGPPVHRAA